MQTADRTNRHNPSLRFIVAAALMAALAQSVALAGDGPKGSDGKAGKKKPLAPVAVRFVDDSTMKVTFLEERIELETPHGKLLIPVADIHHVELASRTDEEAAKRAAAAVADLGHKDFKRRQAATEELAAIGADAYPALMETIKSADLEVSQRAKDLLEKIRQAGPPDRLLFRPFDVVHTEHSKYTGRINVATLKIRTFQFGEQPLRLCDVRGLYFQGGPPGMTGTTSGEFPPPTKPTLNRPPAPAPIPR
jgi:hypothetical protein